MEVGFGEGDGISIQKIPFGDGGGEYPKVRELKEELMEFYRLEEGQIEIAVQGG